MNSLTKRFPTSETLAKLRKYLDCKNWKDFAKLVDRAEVTIKSIELGHRGLTNEMAARIETLTGISRKWLLANQPSKPMINRRGLPYTLWDFNRAQEDGGPMISDNGYLARLGNMELFEALAVMVTIRRSYEGERTGSEQFMDRLRAFLLKEEEARPELRRARQDSRDEMVNGWLPPRTWLFPRDPQIFDLIAREAIECRKAYLLYKRAIDEHPITKFRVQKITSFRRRWKDAAETVGNPILQEDEERWVYAGPTIPGTPLRQGKPAPGSVKDIARRWAEDAKWPDGRITAFMKLFRHIGEYTAVNKELEDEKSATKKLSANLREFLFKLPKDIESQLKEHFSQTDVVAPTTKLSDEQPKIALSFSRKKQIKFVEIAVLCEALPAKDADRLKRFLTDQEVPQSERLPHTPAEAEKLIGLQRIAYARLAKEHAIEYDEINWKPVDEFIHRLALQKLATESG